MDQPAKFWDRVAERYSKRPIADEAAYQKKLQVTREYFRPDMEIVEFGRGQTHCFRWSPSVSVYRLPAIDTDDFQWSWTHWSISAPGHINPGCILFPHSYFGRHHPCWWLHIKSVPRSCEVQL